MGTADISAFFKKCSSQHNVLRFGCYHYQKKISAHPLHLGAVHKRRPHKIEKKLAPLHPCLQNICNGSTPFVHADAIKMAENPRFYAQKSTDFRIWRTKKHLHWINLWHLDCKRILWTAPYTFQSSAIVRIFFTRCAFSLDADVRTLWCKNMGFFKIYGVSDPHGQGGRARVGNR